MMADLGGAMAGDDGWAREWKWMACIGAGCDLDHPINQFIASVLDRPRLIQLREKIKTFEPPYFLLDEKPTMEAGRLRCAVRDRTGRVCAKPRFDDEVEPSGEALCRALDAILRDPALAPFVNDLRIELFVPKAMLSLEADRAVDPHNEDLDLRLGENYCVALRWFERANPAAQILSDRWESLGRAIGGAVCPPSAGRLGTPRSAGSIIRICYGRRTCAS